MYNIDRLRYNDNYTFVTFLNCCYFKPFQNMATTKVIIFVIIFHSIFACALTKVPIFSSHSRGNLTLNIVVKYPEERLQVSVTLPDQLVSYSIY